MAKVFYVSNLFAKVRVNWGMAWMMNAVRFLKNKFVNSLSSTNSRGRQVIYDGQTKKIFKEEAGLMGIKPNKKRPRIVKKEKGATKTAVKKVLRANGFKQKVIKGITLGKGK